MMGKEPSEKSSKSMGRGGDNYWEAVWWLDQAVLAENSTAMAAAWGNSATNFAQVIAQAENIRELCGPRPTN